MAKKKRAKSDINSLTAEAPVRNNRGRRYVLGAVKTLTAIPRNTAIGLNNRVQSNKAVAKMKSLQHDFDLDKAQECITVMGKHESNADIQAMGCSSLASIAIQESRGLIQVGVVDALLNAMEKHPKSKKVVAPACLLVWNLAILDEHKQLLASHGIVDLLVESLSNHEKALSVQHMAIGAVKILAYDSKIKSDLAGKGAMELIITAMKNFSEDDERQKTAAQITETCISALQNFAFGSDCVKRLMELSTGRHVITAMNKYPDDSEIQTSSCGALWNLAIPQVNKLELAEMGATVSIVKALTEFTDNEPLVLNAVGALKNLCILPASLAVLKISNDRKTVIRVLEKCCVVHGDNSDINRIGLELLDILYEEGEYSDDDDGEESVVNIDD